MRFAARRRLNRVSVQRSQPLMLEHKAAADIRSACSMGNGINWKGQVFPHMRNFTASHKMTGVGNALKRHYANFLEAYEAVSEAAPA